MLLCECVEGEMRVWYGEKVERRGAGRVARDARGVDGDELRCEGRWSELSERDDRIWKYDLLWVCVVRGGRIGEGWVDGFVVYGVRKIGVRRRKDL